MLNLADLFDEFLDLVGLLPVVLLPTRDEPFTKDVPFTKLSNADDLLSIYLMISG